MASDAYRLSLTDNVLSHGSLPLQLLHDHPETDEIDALVASGDCLITLATALDETAQFLQSDPEAARPGLEKVIRTLLQLQRDYQLSRKTADHHQ